MKRILLYYDNYCGEKSHGGTEVATARIARALKASGEWEVYNACKWRRCDSSEEIFSKVKVLPRKSFVEDLAQFIRENEIDVVVNMGRFYRHARLRKAAKLSGRDVRLLFMHHFAPGSESIKHTYSAGWHLLKMNPADWKYWIRASLYPVFKLQRRLCLGPMYRKILRECDRVILLSDGYKDQYLKKAFGKKEKAPEGLAEKLVAIPNIYDTPDRDHLTPKENRVLILSRMDEIQKRISLALDIWKKIEERKDLADWQLDIVGNGDDMAAIKKKARRLGLKRANFHGWQDGKPFLEKSSILMSTSLYEGLPLSMIEARTYGCVPIAFNSYASLEDTIEDEKTGVIVEPFGDVDLYAEKLARLMADSEKRQRIAANAKKDTARFSSSAIAAKWVDLLSGIC